MLPELDIIRTESLDDALISMSIKNCWIIAGGADLIPIRRRHPAETVRLLDISGLTDLYFCEILYDLKTIRSKDRFRMEK